MKLKWYEVPQVYPLSTTLSLVLLASLALFALLSTGAALGLVLCIAVVVGIVWLIGDERYKVNRNSKRSEVIKRRGVYFRHEHIWVEPDGALVAITRKYREPSGYIGIIVRTFNAETEQGKAHEYLDGLLAKPDPKRRNTAEAVAVAKVLSEKIK